VRANQQQYGANRTLDGDYRTYWTTDDGVHSAMLTVELDRPVTFDRAMIQEAIALGQRLRSFAIEAWDGHGWQMIGEGTTIGYKRLLRFDPVTASRVRLTIRAARACPAIGEVGLFKASPREQAND